LRVGKRQRKIGPEERAVGPQAVAATCGPCSREGGEDMDEKSSWMRVAVTIDARQRRRLEGLLVRHPCRRVVGRARAFAG
jgi:hypothetical protein